MTAPAIHAAGLRTAQRHHRSERIRRKLRQNANAFIQDAIRLWRYKRDELWRETGAASFDGFVTDPDNKQDSATKVHLQVQVIETCWHHFGIDRVLLYPVGYRKWGIIMPEIEHIREKIRGEFSRQWILDWIYAAHTNTASQLEMLMLEKSIRYQSEIAANQATARHSGTYDTILDNVPMRVGDLWQMTKEELLSWLGAAQMQDDEYLYTRTSRPKPKD